MIIVKLQGGLGNQLFQYAAGRRLANKFNAPLKLDLSWFDSHPERKYQLNHFNIISSVAEPEEVARFTRSSSSFFHKVLSLKPKLASSYIKEKQFHFDGRILNLPDDVYLEGYWQSEKYFKNIESLLREEFKLKSQLSERASELRGRIARGRLSVSLHIRRGDYVTSPLAQNVLGICDLNYYERCLSVIKQKFHQPHFFVFSDDPSWARENLRSEFPMSFVENAKEGRDYEDLWLMSLCQHHILANSSFSWWAAWLNQYPGKVVLAPKKWFVSTNHDPKDLFLNDWILI